MNSKVYAQALSKLVLIASPGPWHPYARREILEQTDNLRSALLPENNDLSAHKFRRETLDSLFQAFTNNIQNNRIYQGPLNIFLYELRKHGFIPDSDQQFEDFYRDTILRPSSEQPAQAMIESSEAVYHHTWRSFPSTMHLTIAQALTSAGLGHHCLVKGPSIVPTLSTLVDSDGYLLIQIIHSQSGLNIGTIRSYYRLNDVIARGESGDIYHAHEIGNFNRKDVIREVAIKIVKIKNQKDCRPILELYWNQSRILPQIEGTEHVQIYKAGVTATGDLFFAMELFPEGALSDWMRKRRSYKQFDLKETLHLSQQIFEVIAHFHQRGIIHRNIKPENIFLAGNAIKIGDFRLAIENGWPDMETKYFTEASTYHERDFDVIGTPAYLPPERIPLGDDPMSPPEPNQDVYALGIVLFELLTGEFPFHGTSALDVMTKVKNGLTVPRPSEVKPEHRIPDFLDRIVLKATSWDPSNRYATAFELLYDLLHH